MPKTVYLGLGSNLGDRLAQLTAAVENLHRPDFQVRRISSIYETEPIGFAQQNPFLNLVLEAETTIFPVRLLQRIENIHREMGRLRLIPNGPRKIDIDILLFGRFIVKMDKLEIPHPRMTERRFVLDPLLELEPGITHPATRKKLRDYLPAAAGQRSLRTSFRIDIPAR